jgi:hypothetical protein
MTRNWAEYLVDPTVIGRLYSPIPALEDVILRSVHLSTRSPAVLLRMDLPIFPNVLPREWKEAAVDRVQCHLQFLAVADFELTDCQLPFAASISVEPRPERRLLVSISNGPVKIGFTSSDSLQVGHFSAYLSGADSTDESEHVFLSHVDRRLYTVVPPPDVKTYHDRV